MNNTVRSINSSNAFVDAHVVERPKGFPIRGRTIVVNTNLSAVTLGEPPVRQLPGFSSTVLVDTTIEQADSVLLLRMTDREPVADIIHEPGWRHFSELLPAFPDDVPLYRGPREDIGSVEFDPGVALGEERSAGLQTFLVRVNLWFAPAGTDCSIHNEHDFIEIHSQVHGYGRMQKFRERDYSALYEDQLMSPGNTNPVPFCRTRPGGGFDYPWHQYRADTDCVWLAVEYHAQAS